MAGFRNCSLLYVVFSSTRAFSMLRLKASGERKFRAGIAMKFFGSSKDFRPVFPMNMSKTSPSEKRLLRAGSGGLKALALELLGECGMIWRSLKQRLFESEKKRSGFADLRIGDFTTGSAPIEGSNDRLTGLSTAILTGNFCVFQTVGFPVLD